MNDEVSKGLEREALCLVRQYGFFLRPAKPFLRKLADFLKWNNLRKELQ